MLFVDAQVSVIKVVCMSEFMRVWVRLLATAGEYVCTRVVTR